MIMINCEYTMCKLSNQYSMWTFRIGHDASGLIDDSKRGWYLEQVNVKYGQKEYTIICRSWLLAKDYLEREFYPHGIWLFFHLKTLSKYFLPKTCCIEKSADFAKIMQVTISGKLDCCTNTWICSIQQGIYIYQLPSFSLKMVLSITCQKHNSHWQNFP